MTTEIETGYDLGNPNNNYFSGSNSPYYYVNIKMYGQNALLHKEVLELAVKEMQKELEKLK